MMNRVEMNEEMMTQVNGCRFDDDDDTVLVAEQRADYFNGIHPNCGGHISNHLNPFFSCECDKCGATNYFYNDFFTWTHSR